MQGESDSFEVDGNRLTLLVAPRDRLTGLLALIEGAQENLRLLYYTFADDHTGGRVRNALVAACERGVQVSLIIDGFGSDPEDAFLQPLRDACVDICRFLPRYGRRFLLRNHQKLCIADEKRLVIGGFNIEDAYFEGPEENGWRDLGLIVEGPAAGRLVGYFDALSAWTKRPKARMRDLRRALRRWSEPKGKVRWLLGGPARRLSPWARTLRTDMLGARSISLIAAYFAPSPAMLQRLDKVGIRGQARVITAAKSDNSTTIAAARFTYPGLLRKGVRIFEYQPSKLHTKLYIIDDAVHIGSANFDMRSLFLNMELMLRIEDRAFAERMRSLFDHELQDSVEIKLKDLAGWGHTLARARNAVAYFLVSTLDYGVTRRLNIDAE
ncbi:putative cardiolipin synthase [Sphingomonas changbaiensis NBRC 104936]|uniref:Phospholipase D n=1 Tax=Sphingomonas changbaiensis NBRC 104936 TaxID=1219043 RepID=A0A0E9MTQ6_9SPHN|nr:phosphatidylserine/phosphatidylglycerophosphate/cardiolipin synthase family protein [Sphingomonas changbaiensis]GAO40505.1 putative cardiolipin synthase [Sphingomonas changbaiensis NBRC 104936]